MHPFLSCVVYLILISASGFLLGRLLPKSFFCGSRFPYKSYAFEKNGKIYLKLNIQHWQNKVPDMSKLFPWCMPAKNLAGDYKSRLPEMIQETCIAELTHKLLCIAGLYCIKLYPGWRGFLIAFLYSVVFNLPFVLIQRYNRPRLMRVEKKLQIRQTDKRSMELV